MSNPTPLSCLVISDGRRGIENQALGLAEAMHRLRPLTITPHHIEHGSAMRAASPGLQIALRSQPEHYGMTAPFTNIAIGCGRQAIAPLRVLKRTFGDDIYTVYVQDPRGDTDHFDRVVAPEHDALSGPNVEVMIGSPNRVTRDLIVKETVAFQDRLNTLPMPRAAFLIGGTSKTHRYSDADLAVHLAAVRSVLDQGHTAMVTLSRRTPDNARTAWLDLASKDKRVWLHDGDGPNPYFAFLGGAEIICVTEDSTNMLTEACATGKTVFRLPMAGKPGKFQELYDSLEKRCHVQQFDGTLTSVDYKPLKETDRIAEQVWAGYDARTEVMN